MSCAPSQPAPLPPQDIAGGPLRPRTDLRELGAAEWLSREFRLLGRPIRLFEPSAECLEGFLTSADTRLLAVACRGAPQKASWSIPVASLMTDHSIPARKKLSIVPS